MSYTVRPGGRVLWCLRRRHTDVRCILTGGVPAEVHVVQESDVVLTEIFPEEWLAEKWAHAYAERLRQQGWFDSA